jgi:hypothetical protein
MNNERRKQIADLIAQLSTIEDDASTLAEQEREYFDNMPESLQQGEKGIAAEEATDDLDNAVMSVSEAREHLQQAMGT